MVVSQTGDCLTAQVPGGELGEPVYLHSLSIRCQSGEGLVFVSMTKPDIDALGACAVDVNWLVQRTCIQCYRVVFYSPFAVAVW